MSEQNQMMGYGGHVADDDKSLQSKTGGKFGLNSNVRITKLAYNQNVAKEGEPAREAIEIVVQVQDKEFKDWISPITKVYGKNNNEIPFTQPPSQEYVDAYNATLIQQKAVMTHYLKALGVPEANIKTAMDTATSFTDWATKLTLLVPGDFNSKPVDVFLEYQYQIGTGQDRTWPTLPKNMKGGYFIVPAVPGVFEEQIDADGILKFVNAAGQEHPFTRSKNFMDSPKAKQQGVGALPANTPAATPNPGMAGNGAAQQGTWT